MCENRTMVRLKKKDADMHIQIKSYTNEQKRREQCRKNCVCDLKKRDCISIAENENLDF